MKLKKTLFGKTHLVIDMSELNKAIDHIFGAKPNKRTYILLKDLPFLKAGTEITYSEEDHGFVTTTPIKLLQEYEGHYLDWMMREEVEHPGTFKDFLKQI